MRSLSEQHYYSLSLNMHKLRFRCWHSVALGVQWKMCSNRLMLNCVLLNPLRLHHRCLVEAVSPTRRTHPHVHSQALAAFSHIDSLWTTSILNDVSCLFPAPHCARASLALQPCLGGIAKCQPLFAPRKQLPAIALLWKAPVKKPAGNVWQPIFKHK